MKKIALTDIRTILSYFKWFHIIRHWHNIVDETHQESRLTFVFVTLWPPSLIIRHCTQAAKNKNIGRLACNKPKTVFNNYANINHYYLFPLYYYGISRRMRENVVVVRVDNIIETPSDVVFHILFTLNPTNIYGHR